MLQRSLAVCCLVVCSHLFSADVDLAEQLQRMQDQMRAMSDKIENQQKKIDDQDRTIAQLKANRTTTIGTNAGSASLTNPDPTPAPHKYSSGDKGFVNDDKKPNERLHSWELPPVTIEGETPSDSGLREEDKVGPYGQPRWTTRRRFTETREYVIPEGQFEFEYWNIVDVPKHERPQVEQLVEAEMGLPYRLQLDLYVGSNETQNKGDELSNGGKGKFNFDEEKVEVRWALADWDKIWGNPTLYAEYTFLGSEADHVEFKTLWSGDAWPRVHWAANTVFEHEMGGVQNNSYELTGGVSYTLVDQKISLGGEAKIFNEDTSHNRTFAKPEVLVGPSFQLSPLKQMHIDFSPLVGVTKNSSRFKSLLIFGWEF